MTFIFNGQGFSTLPRDQATEAFNKLMAAIVNARMQSQ